jgi:hypothetical protein
MEPAGFLYLTRSCGVLLRGVFVHGVCPWLRGGCRCAGAGWFAAGPSVPPDIGHRTSDVHALRLRGIFADMLLDRHLR